MGYAYKNYFNDMNETLGNLGLTQMVDFSTLSRTINGVVKASVQDHIHVENDITGSNQHGFKKKRSTTSIFTHYPNNNCPSTWRRLQCYHGEYCVSCVLWNNKLLKLNLNCGRKSIIWMRDKSVILFLPLFVNWKKTIVIRSYPAEWIEMAKRGINQ